MYRLVDINHNEIHMVAESRYVDLYDPTLFFYLMKSPSTTI